MIIEVIVSDRVSDHNVSRIARLSFLAEISRSGSHWIPMENPMENGGSGLQNGKTLVGTMDDQMIPSGEPLHFAMEHHHAINGKIHYFYGHFQ